MDCCYKVNRPLFESRCTYQANEKVRKKAALAERAYTELMSNTSSLFIRFGIKPLAPMPVKAAPSLISYLKELGEREINIQNTYQISKEVMEVSCEIHFRNKCYKAISFSQKNAQEIASTRALEALRKDPDTIHLFVFRVPRDIGPVEDLTQFLNKNSVLIKKVFTYRSETLKKFLYFNDQELAQVDNDSRSGNNQLPLLYKRGMEFLQKEINALVVKYFIHIAEANLPDELVEIIESYRE